MTRDRTVAGAWGCGEKGDGRTFMLVTVGSRQVFSQGVT